MPRKSPKKTVLSQASLVLAATVIAFALHYWFYHDGGSKDQPQQEHRVVRKEIVEETIPTSSPRADFDRPIRQDPPSQVRQKATSFSSDAPGPSDRLNNSPRHIAEPSTGAPVGRTQPSKELEVLAEKPEYSDAEPPTLISISFDPTEAPPGTNVVVYVRATDNLSGVYSAAGRAKSPSGTATVGFNCQQSDDEGSLVGVIEIPDGAETGTWVIASLRLTDKVQNAKTYTEHDPTLRTAGFNVIGTGSDNTPPTIVDVTIDPTEVRGGDKIRIVVQAEDDQSGVARVHAALISPSNNARISIGCENTEEENVFAGYAVVPKNAESGLWVLEYLQTEDVAKNNKVYYRNSSPELFEQATVRVYGENSDAYPPTLDNLTIIPAAVSYGGQVEIVVSASDDVSGINIVFGGLRSPSGKARIPFSCTYHSETDTYRAQVTMKDNSEVGMWAVEYIRIKDEARNQITYGLNNDLVAGATFEVTGE